MYFAKCKISKKKFYKCSLFVTISFNKGSKVRNVMKIKHSSNIASFIDT